MHLTTSTFDYPQAATAALVVSAVAIRVARADAAKSDGQVTLAPPGWFG